MRHGRRIARLLSAAALVAALGLWFSPPGIEAATAGRFVGWGTDGKITARFSAGLARLDPKAPRVSIGFTPASLTGSDREGFLKTGWWPDSMKQQGMTLYLQFKTSEPTASLRTLHQYAVAFYNYPGNPHETPMSLNYIAEGSALVSDLSDTFRGWGWQELSGDLRAGGRIRGHLAFDKIYENKKDHVGPIHYRWDLDFDSVMQ